MSINWQRLLSPVLLLPFIAALGCGKGYPTEDVLPPSAAERVAQLDALLGTQQSDALRIALGTLSGEN